MNKVDLTYGGKIKTLINVIQDKKLDVNYTIDGKTGLATTTSFLINDTKENFLMITFDYQDLKKLVEVDSNNIKDKQLADIKFYIEQNNLKDMLWGKEILKIIEKETRKEEL